MKLLASYMYFHKLTVQNVNFSFFKNISWYSKNSQNSMNIFMMEEEGIQF